MRFPVPTQTLDPTVLQRLQYCNELFFSEYTESLLLPFVLKFFSEYKMNDEITELKESIDLIKWTLVDAIELNPEMGKEIETAWSKILENLK